MKKFSVTLLVVIALFLGQSLKVNAGHTHTDNCYQIQGAHSHIGSEMEGGKCYSTPVYHIHQGNEKEGGECYETTVLHNHMGDEKEGGECYQTPVFHTHDGNEKVGGNCYQTPVYHSHTGSSSQKGGCYTIENVCGGNIAQERVDVECYVYKSGYMGSTSWPCGCGGTVTQNGYYLSTDSACEKDHGVYYEVSCNSCDKNYTSGSCGTHTGYDTKYYCSICRTSYNSTGKCTKVKSYSANCGKNTTTIEKYSLSCTKNKDSLEGYTLSCQKTIEDIDAYVLSCPKTNQTIEKYEFSCKEKESSGNKVLICKQKETVEDSSNHTKPSKPSQSTTLNQSSKPSQSTTSDQSTTPGTSQVQNTQIKSNISDTSDLSKKTESESKSEEAVFVEFEVECGLMVDGVWVKLLPDLKDKFEDATYSFDGGQTFDSDNKYIYTKDGVYYAAVKTEDGLVKAKKLEICMQDEEYVHVTEYGEFMTEEEFIKSIEQEEMNIKTEVYFEDAYTMAENIKEENILELDNIAKKQENEEKSNKSTLSGISKIISLTAFVCSGVFFLAGFYLKKKNGRKCQREY